MFNASGQKLQLYAKFICGAGVVFCLAIFGAILYFSTEFNLGILGFVFALIFAAVIFVHMYTLALFIYAFGSLVDSSEQQAGHIRYGAGALNNMYELLKSGPAPANAVTGARGRDIRETAGNANVPGRMDLTSGTYGGVSHAGKSVCADEAPAEIEDLPKKLRTTDQILQLLNSASSASALRKQILSSAGSDEEAQRLIDKIAGSSREQLALYVAANYLERFQSLDGLRRAAQNCMYELSDGDRRMLEDCLRKSEPALREELKRLKAINDPTGASV